VTVLPASRVFNSGVLADGAVEFIKVSFMGTVQALIVVRMITILIKDCNE
jgi:hypothetical protein